MSDPYLRYLASRRDPGLVQALLREIERLCALPTLQERQLRIMEVCGTHTMSIYRAGLKKLLPPQIRLLSGPGCPVCVTPAPFLAQVLALAEEPDTVIASFGDMLRVPLQGDSLLQARDRGAEIKLVVSPLDALQLAQEQPHKQVVFVAVGFETTAPLTAATVQLAAQQGTPNFSVLCAHRTMPAALRGLLAGGSEIDALLCPGHVAAVTGADYFGFVAGELHKPAAVAGFEPVDLLAGIYSLVRQLAEGACHLENCYARAVKAEPSPPWLVLQAFYEPVMAEWRGLGEIAASGLALREEYAAYDAARRFPVRPREARDNPACCCGAVLRGELEPPQCPLFGRVCTPDTPQGACMVSAEGNCAAAYRYEWLEEV